MFLCLIMIPRSIKFVFMASLVQWDGGLEAGSLQWNE